MSSQGYLLNLKSKFHSLDLGENDLSNFYTKIMKRQQFCQEYMSSFNYKVILLEAKKDRFSRRVREILSKNMKNINEIIESNHRFQDVVKKFELTPPKITSESKRYDFDLIDGNVAFYQNCRNNIQTINKFLDYLVP